MRRPQWHHSYYRHCCTGLYRPLDAGQSFAVPGTTSEQARILQPTVDNRPKPGLRDKESRLHGSSRWLVIIGIKRLKATESCSPVCEAGQRKCHLSSACSTLVDSFAHVRKTPAVDKLTLSVRHWHKCHNCRFDVEYYTGYHKLMFML